MWRPIHCTKEPYRRLIWAVHAMICGKKGVWDDSKHCTKERGRLIPPAPGVWESYGSSLLSRRAVLPACLVTVSAIREGADRVCMESGRVGASCRVACPMTLTKEESHDGTTAQ
jgi:hypothetical protein